jgi:hypothetical protein
MQMKYTQCVLCGGDCQKTFNHMMVMKIIPRSTKTLPRPAKSKALPCQHETNLFRR